MSIIDSVWLRDFDASMKQLFAIDHVDAGMDDVALSRYVDLPPREAALKFGDDYDLERLPTRWPY